MAPAVTFDAILLCGGSSRRLGGADKATVVIGGVTLFDRAVAALGNAKEVVAVGPRRATNPKVRWTQEQPPGGGPASAIAAGLAATSAEIVCLLGVDFPFVDRARVESMLEELAHHDGVMLADAGGNLQPLVGVYKRGALGSAVAQASLPNASVRELITGLDVNVLVDPLSTRDCDTWEQIAAAERMLGSGVGGDTATR